MFLFFNLCSNCRFLTHLPSVQHSQETRLGKLINDVRKKTKDEDLAKRAKKLVRNWQKLIEPGPPETPSRGPTVSVPGSTNGGSHPCRTEASPPDVSMAGKVVPEVKIRNDVHNTHSPKAEKPSSRKRRGDHGDSGLYLQAKISKISSSENSVSSPPTNGIVVSPEAPADQEVIPSPDRSRTEHLENDKHARIPVNAVKPCPSSPGVAKLPSTSSLIKAAVMQQQARMDEGGGGGGGGAGGGCYYQAKSPRCLTSTSPRSAKQETMSKRSSTYAPKGMTVPSPSARGSPLPLSQSLTSSSQESGDGPPPSSSSHRLSSMHWASPSEVPSHRSPHNTASTLEPPSISPPPSHLSQHNAELLRPSSLSPSEVPGGGEPKGKAAVASTSEQKKRKKYRSRDYAVNLDGQKTEDTTKPVRLKERRLTFDPVTGQIKSLVLREPSSQTEEVSRLQSDPAERSQRTEATAPQPPSPASTLASASTPAPASTSAPTPSPFQQTNWKELSRNEIIQSYLNIQSNVLNSSGVHASSAHFFMSEYLKREEHDVKEARKTHVLQMDSSAGADLPGVSREVSDEDLNKIHTQHWPGVNGCYDTQGSWYDWTDCISLDPHGDQSKLNILPYICLE